MTVAAIQSEQEQTRAGRAVRVWLFAVAGLVATMVLVGGAVRLTDSGLSITEWKPLLGAIPPLTEADWQDAFAKYKQIPQFTQINHGMTVAEFQAIYWWEWAHRFLGRFIGVAIFAPFVVFWAIGALPPRFAPKLALLLVLGGLQGALGWYMVSSGLVDRVDVSQYRLAAHLSVAVIIFGYALWLALDFGRPPVTTGWTGSNFRAFGFVALVLAQIALGGFVAGLNAGKGYNTWPLMDGRLIPQGFADREPFWRNLFENAATVQLDHRMVAYLVVLAIVANVIGLLIRRAPPALLISATILLILALCQVSLGIATLIHAAPVGLSFAHQAGAMTLFAAAVVHFWLTRREAELRSWRAPDRGPR